MTARSCRPIVLAIALLLARESSGQALSPYDELAAQVRSEDRIIVTTAHSRPVEGRFASLSDTALRIATHGTVRDFRFADVERVDRIRPDGLKNGALWGLAAGLGAAFLAPPVFKTDDEDTSTVLGLFVVPAARAAAGALIDRSITDSVPIYVRRRIALGVAFGAAGGTTGASAGVTLTF